MHFLSLSVAAFAALASAGVAHRRAPRGDSLSGLDGSGALQIRSGTLKPRIFTSCVNSGEIALTYDDGPMIYTEALLAKLNGAGMKATFFLNGDNYGRGFINDTSLAWPALINRMRQEGHQVGSHSWSHPNLDQISREQVRNELLYLETAMCDIMGSASSFLRPPFGSCNSQTCSEVAAEYNFNVVNWNFDTEDWRRDVAATKQSWDSIIGASDPGSSSWIVLAHDPLQITVEGITDHMIASIQQKGFRTVTIGQCLGIPEANWYRTDYCNGGGSPPPDNPPDNPDQPISTFRCGPEGGNARCASPLCCSQWGYCGESDAHCLLSQNCKPDFGICRSGDAPPPPSDDTDDFQCGPQNGNKRCSGSLCCSQYGWCGDTDAYCLASNSCQPAFGTCR